MSMFCPPAPNCMKMNLPFPLCQSAMANGVAQVSLHIVVQACLLRVFWESLQTTSITSERQDRPSFPVTRLSTRAIVQ